MLATGSDTVTRILEEKARPLIERFAAGGNEVEQSMVAASDKARWSGCGRTTPFSSMPDAADVRVDQPHGERQAFALRQATDLIERLAQSNNQLSELIDLAATSLNAVDGKLGNSTQAFAASTERAAQTFSSSARLLDSNTTRLTELTSETLKAVAGIATRFDEHSKLLATASDILGSGSDQPRDHARRSPAGAGRSGRRSGQEVGRHRAADALLQICAGKLARPRRRPAPRTRQASSAHRWSMSSRSATQRFADATEEIRRTAQTIRSELDETRSALQKGVIDMPAEAKDRPRPFAVPSPSRSMR